MIPLFVSRHCGTSGGGGGGGGLFLVEIEMSRGRVGGRG